jgi:ABC-2 type transport system permease protein
MEKTIPSTSTVMAALLRADLTTQWRNRRSFILVLLVPVIILLSWKRMIDQMGAAFVLSSSLTVGLMAIGVMGYSNTIARDRDKGIFQRLRVAPLPGWAIMSSRMGVQLVMILLVTAVVFLVGYNADHAILSPAGYALAFATAFIGGTVYLGLGQVIVGLIKNPETVNSTSRLVYISFMMVGILGEFGVLGKDLQKAVVWSPYGTVEKILSASMVPSTWTSDTSTALLVTCLYAAVFFAIGVKRFQWTSR